MSEKPKKINARYAVELEFCNGRFGYGVAKIVMMDFPLPRPIGRIKESDK